MLDGNGRLPNKVGVLLQGAQPRMNGVAGGSTIFRNVVQNEEATRRYWHGPELSGRSSSWYNRPSSMNRDPLQTVAGPELPCSYQVTSCSYFPEILMHLPEGA
ncbi:hypothetical protein BS78_03G270200 [Paspalum vaginatum]|nr:hypothetical protein BS78_03G270200 [Paspalum vaginatum]